MRRYAVLIAGVLVAAVCVRLGVWQLDRLDQRKTRNAAIEDQLSQQTLLLQPGMVAALSPASRDAMAYRRATATGVFDFQRELVVMTRVYRGVPGVHVVTPLLVATDTAVLVERGWAPAPDGRSVVLADLRERDSTAVEGVLLALTEAAASTGEPIWPRYVRTLDSAVLDLFPYVVLPVILRRTVESATFPAAMRPMSLVERTNGPHLSYALQWFSFAAIALIGSIVLSWRLGVEQRSVPSGGVQGEE